MIKRILLLFSMPILAVSCAVGRGDGESQCRYDDVSVIWNAERIAASWKYEHQDTATVTQFRVEDDLLYLTARKNTFDRTKLHTEKEYTSGTYTWKAFIPEVGEGDMTSTGAFIYCDDRHELDFEVGWGTEALREQAGCSSSKPMVACMTNQDYPNSSSAVAVSFGWHEFSITLNVVDGKYDAQWRIDGIIVKTLPLQFGPETVFRVYVSVENLKFIGQHIASQDNTARYEWVKFDGKKTHNIHETSL